jgi:hypothetical protein
MPKGLKPRLVPRRFATVGAMAAEGVSVRSWCRSCGLVLNVSPAMLSAYYGADFSLVDRIVVCRSVTCEGETFFLANGHGRYETLLIND